MALIIASSPIMSTMATPQFDWDEETLRGKPEWVEQYPNGLINFATVGYVSEEESAPYEVAVIRQGGTEGEATVTFKAVGITAEYGKDYVLLDENGNELVMGEYIPPLIDSLLPGTTPSALALEGIDDVYKVLEEQYVSTTSPALEIKPPVEEIPEVNITKPEGLVIQEKSEGALNLKQAKKSLHGIDGVDLDMLGTDIQPNKQVDEMVRASLPGVMGTLNFQPGERIKYFTVKILEDNESEDEEIFALILQQPTNGAQLGAINSINVYIQDNEPKEYSTISLEQDHYSLEHGAEYVDLTVRREDATYLFSSVQVGTGAITAKPNENYEPMLVEVLFYPGETEKTIRIPVYTNWYQEAIQFGIKLINPSNAKLGQNSSAMITLLGNNEQPAPMAETKSLNVLGSDQVESSEQIQLNEFYRVKQDEGASANIGNPNWVSANYTHYRNGESIIQKDFNPVGYYAMDIHHRPGGNTLAWKRGRSYLQLLMGGNEERIHHDEHHDWQTERFNFLGNYTRTEANNAAIRVRASADINSSDTFFKSNMTGYMDIDQITLHKVAYTANIGAEAGAYKYIDTYGNEVPFEQQDIPRVTLTPSEQNSLQVGKQYVNGTLMLHVADNEYFKYKGYKIVLGNKESKLYTGKNVTMTQEFLHENRDKIEYQAANGTGKFTIVPVFERRTLPYEIQQSKDYTVELFKGDTTNSYPNQESGSLYVGDWVKVKVTPTDSTKATTTIDVSTYADKYSVSPDMIGKDTRYVQDVTKGEVLLELKGAKYQDRYMKIKPTIGNAYVPVGINLEGNSPAGSIHRVFIPKGVDNKDGEIRSGSTIQLVAIEPEGYRAHWTINGESYVGSLIEYVVKGTGNAISLEFNPISTPLSIYEIKGRVEAESLTLKNKYEGMIGVEGASVSLGERATGFAKDNKGDEYIITTPRESVLTDKNGYYQLQIKGYPGERHFITVSENGHQYLQLIELGKEDTFDFETDLRIDRAYPTEVLATQNQILYEKGNIIYLNDINITFKLRVRSDKNTVKGVNFIIHTKDGIEKSREFVSKETGAGYYAISRNPSLAFKPGDQLVIQIVENDKEFPNGKPGQLINTGYSFIRALDSTDFELDLPAIKTPADVSVPLLGALGPKFGFTGLEFEQEADEDGNLSLTAGYNISTLPGEKEEGSETAQDKVKELGEKIKEVKQSTKKKPKDSDSGIAFTKDMQLNKDTNKVEENTNINPDKPEEESPYTIQPIIGLSMVLGQFEDENGITVLSMREMNIFVGVNGSTEFNFQTITPIGIPVYLGVGMEAKIMLMGIMTPKDGIENLALTNIRSEMTEWQAEIPMMIALRLSAGMDWSNLLGVGVWGKGEMDILWVPWDNGKGTLTLSAGVEVFVLTFKKEWALAEGKFDLFNTMSGRTGRMMSFEELQETIYLDELELISRDYLNNQSNLGESAHIMPFATLGKQQTTMLLSIPYPLPQTQWMSIGNGKYLMVFLTDDMERPVQDAGAVAWAIYDEKSGVWSDIKTIQNDGTLDSSPILSDLGNQILISWTSVNRPMKEIMTTTSTALDVLSATDVYCQLFDKSTASLEGPVFTITEEYGTDLSRELYTQDAMPVAAKSKSGEIILFYTKTDYSSDANRGMIIDEVQEVSSAYSDIAYRLYDPVTKTWREDYFPHETQYTEPDGNGVAWATILKGQRLINARIPSEDLIPGCDPRITAMQAITVDEMRKEGESYPSEDGQIPPDEQFGDKAILAYSVDLDGYLETTYDQEMYIQIYYFSTHEMSHPIRVTDNQVADHTPQVIYHQGESYLFWNQEGRIVYHDIQSLTLNGLEKIKANHEDYMYRVKEDYQSPYQVFDTKYQSIGNNFKVVAGEDGNLYIVWTEHAGRAIDFFGVGLDRTHQDDETKNHGWSKPVRLTYFGDKAAEGSEVVNEMFDVAVGIDGRMHIVNYQKEYDLANYIPTDEKPLPDIITSALIHTVLSAEPSLKIETTFEEDYPVAGEPQTIQVKIRNTGLLAATTQGDKPAVEANVWMETDKIQKAVGQCTLDYLGTSEEKEWMFEYTLAEGELEQNANILIEYSEGGFNSQQIRYAIPYESKVQINSIHIESREQHLIEGVAYVENVGNKPMDTGTFIIQPVDAKNVPYDNSRVEVELEPMGVNEVQEVNFTVAVEEEWLSAYNTLATKVYVLSDGLTEPFPDTVRAKQMKHFDKIPVTNIFTTLDQESTVTLTVGKVKELKPIIYPNAAATANTVTVTADDQSIIGVEGHALVAIKPGTTIVRVRATPDGFERVYQVTVKDVSKPPTPDGGGSSGGSNKPAPPDSKPEEVLKEVFKEYFEVSLDEVEIPLLMAPDHWAQDVILRAVANGVLDVDEELDIEQSINRAELAKLLGRMFKLERQEEIEVSYTDADVQEEYASYLAQLQELGILMGTGDDSFSPESFTTREQVVSIMVRLYEKLTDTTIELTQEELMPFKDEDISSWAELSIAKAAKVGIAYGMGDGFFGAQQETSYAHVLAFVERVALLVNTYEEEQIKVKDTKNLQ